MLRSRQYLGVLILGAVLGVPVSAIAYFFLKASAWLQSWSYTSLADELGFSSTPTWWPLPVLAVGGLLVAAVIRYLPGRAASHRWKVSRPATPPPQAIVGIALAALATLGTGFVLGRRRS